MNRRSFLKTLSALAGAFAAPAIAKAPTVFETMLEPLPPIASAPVWNPATWGIRSMALASEPVMIDITSLTSSVKEYAPGSSRMVLTIELFLDRDIYATIQDAMAAEEPVSLDLPMLRQVGVARNDWHIVSCRDGSPDPELQVAWLELLPATRPLNRCPPEEGGPRAIPWW